MPTGNQAVAVRPQEYEDESPARREPAAPCHGVPPDGAAALVARSERDFLGLAPFLRASIAGDDLRQAALTLIERASAQHANPALWMNLATALCCIGEQTTGLQVQAQALQMQQTFRLPAARRPARFRLLMLMAAGGIDENTPLDCLLEDSGIDLTLHYVSIDTPLPAEMAEHDAIYVAISDSTANRPLLEVLAPLLAGSEKPVLNAPANIPNTERRRASDLLQGIPGLQMPPTRPIARADLARVAAGEAALGSVFAGCRFPIILRPVGSHAGNDLARLDDAEGIGRYLAEVGADDFYLSNFIDYSGTDGLFRKYRVALIAGRPFASHMGISSHWMIHYVNAGMYEDAAKRREEEAFMASFTDFAHRHAAALEAIHRRSGLDYVCIDCAETREGDLLVFEIDHAMVVHAMDPEALFPYKQVHMRKVREAFEDFLVSLRQAPGGQPQ